MTKGTKIWLWCALVLSVATTALNLFSGRILSVVIAVGALAGLCLLLFAQRKAGFGLLCGCYLLAFANGVAGGIMGGTGVVASVLMSLVGSLLIPGVTYLFLRGQFDRLK